MMNAHAPSLTRSAQRWTANLVLLAVVFALTHSGSAWGQTAALKIKVGQLCRHVDQAEREPRAELPDRATVARGPVAFWTVLSGDAATLTWLRQMRLLPVKHVWTRTGAASVTPETPDEVGRDPEAIRVGTIRHLQRLGAEVKQSPDQRFDWRTWSSKRALQPGQYEVKVVFANDQPVHDLHGQPLVRTFTYQP